MEAFVKQTSIQQTTLESLVKHHSHLVKRIAQHLLNRLPQSIYIEDLIQAGMEGLLEAVKKYDETKGASFETYAGIRIRGHILDEVRRNDWVPRSVYRNARMISEASKQIENRLGREAKDTEVASELDITMGEYRAMQKDSAGSHVYGFEDLGVTEDVIHLETENESMEPYKNQLLSDIKEQLKQIKSSLSPKESMVLSLYYEQDLNLKEIGDVMDISESRVCQIHTQAINRVKSKLEP